MKNDENQINSENPDALSLKNEIIGIILLFVTIFLIFSVISYRPTDASFFHDTPIKNIANYGGRVGAEISALLFNLFGFTSYIILLYLLFMTSFFLLNKRIKNVITKSCGYFLLLLSSAAFIANVKPETVIAGQKVKTGGIIGYLINDFFQSQIKQVFSLLFFLVLITISLILAAKISLRKILKFLFAVSLKAFKYIRLVVANQVEKYKKHRRIKRIQDKYKNTGKPVENGVAAETTYPDDDKKSAVKERKKSAKEPGHLPEEGFLFSEFEENAGGTVAYKPPPLSYLDSPTEKSKIDFKELEEKKEELSKRLAEFHIRGEILEYTPGPVITTYEFVPDTGVKVKNVTSLAEDLALVVKAHYVRIERILGKKAIGIEIPNKKREIIHLREILESQEYRESSSPLTFAVGKTKSGEIFITDLRDMPHLIIAGATGSGKSVAIHSLILSILYRASPDEVKFVLIDPKRVELAIYNTLPHLLTPVVVNTKLAKNALDWAVFEMETRYKKLAVLQARNVEQYNRKLDLLMQSEDETLDQLESKEKLPYIVIVIDEFADLMMECSKDIENDIAKIAQKARAVGIHLILATQRPSIDVITGTIKNNFPSRIALAVPSKHDSRTIIDVMGAEKLLGNGDMLFLPPKTASLIRLHSAYVSEGETLRVVNYLSKMAKPKFNSQVLRPIAKEEEADIADREFDAMFFEAAEVVINSGQASASFLQRKMSIGYARAGRLIDQLQMYGVVSAADSQNKRDVLMTLVDLEKLQPQN